MRKKLSIALMFVAAAAVCAAVRIVAVRFRFITASPTAGAFRLRIICSRFRFITASLTAGAFRSRIICIRFRFITASPTACCAAAKFVVNKLRINQNANADATISEKAK